MSTYWFKPKRYGYGAMPVTWQGWLVILVYTVIVAGCALLVLATRLSPWGLGAAVIGYAASTAVLFHWTRLKTDGGFRWRWGNDH
jgi:O-antigen/teichoic acid export membrane protein